MACIVPWLPLIGSILGMVGAVLVASEIVWPYHGKKYTIDDHVEAEIMGDHYSPEEIETNKYQVWQDLKNKRMKWGLVFLLFGITLQIIGIIGNWPC